MSTRMKCGESKSLKFSQHSDYTKRSSAKYSYKCQCGKDFRKERKLTKHKIKHGHGDYKKQTKYNWSYKTSFKIKEEKKKDLLGSILTGMDKNTNREREWEGEMTPPDTTLAYTNTATTANSVVSKKNDWYTGKNANVKNANIRIFVIPLWQKCEYSHFWHSHFCQYIFYDKSANIRIFVIPLWQKCEYSQFWHSHFCHKELTKVRI